MSSGEPIPDPILGTSSIAVVGSPTEPQVVLEPTKEPIPEFQQLQQSILEWVRDMDARSQEIIKLGNTLSNNYSESFQKALLITQQPVNIPDLTAMNPYSQIGRVHNVRLPKGPVPPGTGILLAPYLERLHTS